MKEGTMASGAESPFPLQPITWELKLPPPKEIFSAEVEAH
jgi:hypothetical protein